MTEQDRRDFLKRLAKSAVYAAPVVYSLAAPADVLGQGWTRHHPKMATTFEQQQPQQPTTTTQPGGDAPWEREPPGGEPPGGTRRR